MAVAFSMLAMTTGAGATLLSAFWAEAYSTKHIGSIKAIAAAVMVFGSAVGPGLTGVLMDVGIPLERQFLGIAAYLIAASILMLWGVRRNCPAP